jgi:hypothetical protein
LTPFILFSTYSKLVLFIPTIPPIDKISPPPNDINGLANAIGPMNLATERAPKTDNKEVL